ncbi:hypothetical protein [Streptomyces sp. NPDC058657]|uniref:hypothetical protein n=1 Tax=unclassified Streptomyces TaxID=2593676 RepID=UPI0036573E39
MSVEPDRISSASISEELAGTIRANVKHRSAEYVRRETAGAARLAGLTRDEAPRPGDTALRLDGALTLPPREFPAPDGPGAARLRELDAELAVVREAFPALEPDIKLCRLVSEMLEGAWRERAEGAPRSAPAPGGDMPCTCLLCSRLPVPPPRRIGDYAFRRSDGQPLAVKTWPYRQELDCVLTGGWVWNRALQDADTGRALRYRYEDDILTFPEYKRTGMALDISATTRAVRAGLAENFDINGARALVSGIFINYKRAVDEYWIGLHRKGEVTLPQSTPLDRSTYCMLQTMDCLWWHVSPDDQLWLEENLAILVMSRMIDDMVDVRADAASGEINNFWLADMPAHDKTMLAASVVALVKYACMPESRGVLWNVNLVGATAVWMGLNGRHGLWFDGIPEVLPPVEDCVLCRLRPNPCTGLLTSGISLRTGPRPTVRELGARAAELSERCRSQCPPAWELFHEELAGFEALHGEWRGDTDTTWEILRRTYVAAIEASLTHGDERGDGDAWGDSDPQGGREVRGERFAKAVEQIQHDSGQVGAEFYHTLNMGGAPGWRENTVLLMYLFGAAHPHFLWNSLGHVPTALDGDWLDG